MNKKFRFEDLQPHVDMLCDALENRGASSSGLPNEAVYPQAQGYRNLLTAIRERRISEFDVLMMLAVLKAETMQLAGNNQRYRVKNIVDALDYYIRKEYNSLVV